MFISKKRFEELVKEKEDQESTIKEKDAQIESLQTLLEKATKINHAKANENGCVIGEWCKQCRYGRQMRDNRSFMERNEYGFLTGVFKYINNDLGYYCTKHMTDVCPEFKGF